MSRSALAAAFVVLAACGARSGLVDVDGPGDAGIDATFDAPTPTTGAPRLIAPLSTSTTRGHAPELRWKNPDGVSDVRLQLCGDRACAHEIAALDVTAEHARLAPLDAGVYFWRVRVADDPARSSATWELFVSENDATTKTAWGTELDVDGDGLADLVTRDIDHLDVRSGVRGGTPATIRQTISLPPYGDTLYVGLPLPAASGGDLDGDGFPELVLQAEAPSGDREAAYVYSGGAGGVSSSPRIIVAPDPWVTSTPLFADVIRCAGDVDGDGYGDLLSTMPAALDGLGRAFVYRGSATGVETTPSLTFAGSDTFGAGFGSDATVIDVDGDGTSELAIAESTRVALFRPPSTTPLLVVDGALGGGGDFDGDGYGDLLVDASGELRVFRGGASGISSARVTHVGPGAGVVVGDVDGDGLDDVIANVGGNATLWRGDRSAVLVLGPALGTAMRRVRVGDADGDGRQDVAFETSSSVVPASFSLRLGTATGIAPSSALDFSAMGVGASQ